MVKKKQKTTPSTKPSSSKLGSKPSTSPRVTRSKVSRRKAMKLDCIFQNQGISFKDWLASQKATKSVLYAFTPYKCNITRYLLDNTYKNPMWNIICAIYDIQNLGFCLEENAINEENLVVIYGQVKFVQPKLVRYTESRARQNFIELSQFFTETFFENIPITNLPQSMSSLLTLLNTVASDKDNEILVRYHLAVMHEECYEGFITSWFEVQKQLTSAQKADYERACKKLPNINTWSRKIKKKAPFCAVYNHVKGSFGGLNGKIFNSTDQPRFWRNSVHHLLDGCWKGKTPSKGNQPHYKMQDIGKMIVCVFPEATSKLPELLHDVQLLSECRPWCYFPQVKN